jgi:hypothetical protein
MVIRSDPRGQRVDNRLADKPRRLVLWVDGSRSICLFSSVAASGSAAAANLELCVHIELERRLLAPLDALGPAPRAELLHVLMLPDLERAERIGEFWSHPQSRTFAELLIDCEDDQTLRAMLVGMLREAER